MSTVHWSPVRCPLSSVSCPLSAKIDQTHLFSMTAINISGRVIFKICISKFNDMQQMISTNSLTAIQQQRFQLAKARRLGFFTRFINWCDLQECNRFLWLGIALMGSIGMVLPLTLVTVLLTSQNFILLAAAAIANVPVLAVNLAAQPTKVTLPFLFSAWLVNFSVIVYSFITFLL
jgi:hypothetical protein